MDGEQIELVDYLEELEKLERLKQRFPIPELDKKYLTEERWTDTWHYTEIEKPEKPGVYYCIQYSEKYDSYIYTYMAWAYGYWWQYAGWGDNWLFVNGERRKYMLPFAWVVAPDLYYQTDKHFQFLCEHFVKREDWEHEKKMMEIREENAKWREAAGL